MNHFYLLTKWTIPNNIILRLEGKRWQLNGAYALTLFSLPFGNNILINITHGAISLRYNFNKILVTYYYN